MAEAETDRGFDPGRFLTKVGQADYLEVKWRLVWLREVAPDAVLSTELVEHRFGEYAVVKASVSIPGGGHAEGYGSETYSDFREYLEKAETKAIGRALAALGFGTQFSRDYEYGADQGRVVDSPVDFAASRGQRTATGGGGGNYPATPRQLKFVRALAAERGMDDQAADAEAVRLYGKPIAGLGSRDASAFIERLQAMRSGAEPDQAPASETWASVYDLADKRGLGRSKEALEKVVGPFGNRTPDQVMAALAAVPR